MDRFREEEEEDEDYEEYDHHAEEDVENEERRYDRHGRGSQHRKIGTAYFGPNATNERQQNREQKRPSDALYAQKIRGDLHLYAIIAQMADFWMFSEAGIPLHPQSEVIPDESRLNDLSALAGSKYRQIYF